ncbi:MAG: flagellin, partial [Aliarcobacter sp.]
NIAGQTNYNGTYLLQASGGTGATASAQKSALTFQIGEKTSDIISTENIQANTTGYGLTTLSAAVTNTATFSITKAAAAAGQTAVDAAITTLNGYRGDIGSTQNQVESAVRNLMTQATNIKNAESVIRDVDYAEESANFNKLNIISQAGSYAISQANAVSQNVLRLLQ